MSLAHLLLLAGALLLAACCPDRPAGPLLVAHRGNSSEAPENTVQAVRAALTVQPPPEYVEVDVRRSADGRLVVIHDADLERTTGRSGKVSRLTWSEIQARSTAAPVPLLEEVLDAVAGTGTGIMIEVKEHGLGAPVARLVAGRDEQDRHVLASFHADVLADARETVPRLRRLLLTSEPDRGAIALARDLGADLLGVDQAKLDRGVVAAARAAGLRVWAWTVDDPVRARQLLDLGTEAVISNRPRALRAEVWRRP